MNDHTKIIRLLFSFLFFIIQFLDHGEFFGNEENTLQRFQKSMHLDVEHTMLGFLLILVESWMLEATNPRGNFDQSKDRLEESVHVEFELKGSIIEAY